MIENRKILIVTSSYFFVNLFLLPHIEHLAQNGWTVHIASADDGSTIPHAHKLINIPICRSPFKTDNFKAIKKLKSIIEEEKYDIIHCHTPIGAMVARLAARKARKKLGTKVIYTAHGFHFYKGAPLKNWLLYFTAEKALAPLTDAIITINSEDVALSSKHFNEIGKQFYVPGIGYNIKHIGNQDSYDKNALREKYNLHKDDFICLYIARYTHDKNHQFLIKSLPALQQIIPNSKLLFVGDGDDMKECRNLAHKLGVENSVIFAGFQINITDYLLISDIGVSPSVSEGLGLGLVEEMCMALPIVASKVRGHKDLIQDGRNGLLYTLNDSQNFIDKIVFLYNNPDKRTELGRNARQNVSKYSVENIIPQITAIYNELLTN